MSSSLLLQQCPTCLVRLTIYIYTPYIYTYRIYIYIYIYTHTKNIYTDYIYILAINIFNSWNLDCDPRFHGFFCKTTIIRQSRRRNESKIENTKKCRQKPLGFRLCVVVSV